MKIEYDRAYYLPLALLSSTVFPFLIHILAREAVDSFVSLRDGMFRVIGNEDGYMEIIHTTMYVVVKLDSLMIAARFSRRFDRVVPWFYFMSACWIVCVLCVCI